MISNEIKISLLFYSEYLLYYSMTAIRMKKEDRILHILDCTLTLVGRKQLESIRTA